MEQSDVYDLEIMIDKHGLYAVVDALAAICSEKAEHLRSAWQDKQAAKNWGKASNKFDTLNTSLRALQIP